MNTNLEIEEKFYLFYSGLFSQWAKIDMIIDGVLYDCAEKWMMWNKAKMFNDQEMMDKIMASDRPEEMKMQYGRNVKGFDKKIWEEKAREIVYIGNYAKFTQNQDCLQELAKSRGKTIVEASPYDVIWGIGIGQYDPRAKDRKQWRGTNWLGEAIMRMRDKMQEEGWFDKL